MISCEFWVRIFNYREFFFGSISTFCLRFNAHSDDCLWRVICFMSWGTTTSLNIIYLTTFLFHYFLELSVASNISPSKTAYLTTTPSRAIPMPAYYEMLVSQSPPLFSHSPPTGFLSEYGPNRFYESPRFCRSAAVLTPPSARRFPPQMQAPSLYQAHLQSLTPYRPSTVPKPKRSCLIVRNEDPIKSETTSESSDESDDGEKVTRSKKRVVFADDKGLELEHVKIMSEASTQPPTWSLQFLAHVTQGMISPVPQEQWTIDFRQPASDYLEFR